MLDRRLADDGKRFDALDVAFREPEAVIGEGV